MDKANFMSVQNFALPPLAPGSWGASVRAVGAVLVGLLVTAVAVSLVQELKSRPLAAVKIVGEFHHVQRGSLQQRLAAFTEAGFIAVDVAKLRQAALSHPWVKQVSVRRVWPDSLHVSVVERAAVAHWNNSALLEADGSAFEPASIHVNELPWLEGPLGREQDVLAMFRQLHDAIGPFAGGITRLTLSSRGAWQAELAQGAILVLGRSPDLPRLRSYVRAFPQVFQDQLREIARVDLRYTNGFAVRFRTDEATNVKSAP